MDICSSISFGGPGVAQLWDYNNPFDNPFNPQAFFRTRNRKGLLLVSDEFQDMVLQSTEDVSNIPTITMPGFLLRGKHISGTQIINELPLSEDSFFTDPSLFCNYLARMLFSNQENYCRQDKGFPTIFFLKINDKIVVIRVSKCSQCQSWNVCASQPDNYYYYGGCKIYLAEEICASQPDNYYYYGGGGCKIYLAEENR